jgi:pyruvate ferredoxin oxidoreductase gamma subunit
MHELRFHGRGGQGAVTSAEVLALSAIGEGLSAQAFPSFGPERRGAPVIAFARVADRAIRIRSAVVSPSVVVVLDPSLLRLVKVADGLRPDGVLVVNTRHGADVVRALTGFSGRVVTLDANRIAREEIGRVITNTAMLGALLAEIPLVEPEAIERTLEARFGRGAEANIRAFRRSRREAAASHGTPGIQPERPSRAIPA